MCQYANVPISCALILPVDWHIGINALAHGHIIKEYILLNGILAH